MNPNTECYKTLVPKHDYERVCEGTYICRRCQRVLFIEVVPFDTEENHGSHD